MAKLDLRNHRPSVEMLPDGRQRATFTYDVREWVGRTLADIAAECWADWGAAAPGDFSALLLVKQELKGLEPDKTGALPLVRIYEELHATDETQVGEDSIAYGEDGGKTIVAQFIQFASSPATPGTINTTTAPNDATLYLNSEDSESDGTLRRIKRTYVQAGQVSTSEEVKNNGALTLRTITSVRTIPATPSGFTLVSSSVKNPDGVPTYSYTFAKGSGTISVSDDVKYNGSLHTRTIRSIGASPSTPSGYTLVSYDSTEQDGYTLYSYNFAKGDGTVSISEDTKNNGNLSTITIRALGTAPETPSGYTLVSLDESKQDGYTVYTSSFAKGDGVISSEDDVKNNGKLTLRTIRALGTAPATPSGFTLTNSNSSQQDGYTLYTYQFAKGVGRISIDTDEKHNGALVLRTIRYLDTDDGSTPSGALVNTTTAQQDGYALVTKVYAAGAGQISQTTDFSQSSDQGVHGITRVTVRYLVAPDGTIQPTSLAGFIRIGEDFTEQDGYRVWTTTWVKGTGTVSTQDETKNNGALLMRTIRAIGAAPSTPSGYVLVSADSSEQDGITVYTSSFAQGSGEISRAVDYSQSSDLGVTGVTRTTIRYLVTSGASVQPTALSGSIAVGQDSSEADGYRIWTTTWAKGTGTVSSDVETRNNGNLKIYKIVALGAAPAAPTATIGGTVTLISDGSRNEAGFVVYDRTWAEGKGVIETREQQRPGGLKLVTWVSLGQAYDAAYMLPAGVLMAKDSDDRDGHTVWTVTAMQNSAGGASLSALGAVASIAVSNIGSGYLTAPTVTLSAPPSGGVQATAHAVLGDGITTGSQQVVSVVVDTAGSGYSSAPTITFTPTYGGSGAAATATLDDSANLVAGKHPFRYPGRAKAISTTILGSVAYDVYRSPPVDVLVDATTLITYSTTASLGTLPAALWNPDSWATIIASYWALSGWPKAVIESLPGYRSISETPLAFTGMLVSCLGELCYSTGTGTPYSLAVKGGPANPEGNTYTLAAEIDPEPAFVAYDGTKYYRRTFVIATIPTQTALPV